MQCESQGFFDRDRTLIDALGEGRAFDQLQHEEMLPVGLFESMNGCDVGMIERSQQLGFPAETGNTVRVPCELLGQDLDGNLPA